MEEIFNIAKEYYGTTFNLIVAGFILPDGSLLDFSGAKFGGSANNRTIDHHELSDAFEDIKYNISMEDFINAGAIRLSYISNSSTSIHMAKLPTNIQFSILEKIVSNSSYLALECNKNANNPDSYTDLYVELDNPKFSKVKTLITNFFNGKKDSELAMFHENMTPINKKKFLEKIPYISKQVSNKYWAFGGNCGNFAIAFVNVLEKMGFNPALILCMPENYNKNDLIYGEPDIYHVAFMVDNKIYDGDGEQTIKSLEQFCLNEYNNPHPVIVKYSYTLNKDWLAAAIRYNTNYCVSTNIYEEIIENIINNQTQLQETITQILEACGVFAESPIFLKISDKINKEINRLEFIRVEENAGANLRDDKIEQFIENYITEQYMENIPNTIVELTWDEYSTLEELNAAVLEGTNNMFYNHPNPFASEEEAIKYLQNYWKKIFNVDDEYHNLTREDYDNIINAYSDRDTRNEFFDDYATLISDIFEDNGFFTNIEESGISDSRYIQVYEDEDWQTQIAEIRISDHNTKKDYGPKFNIYTTEPVPNQISTLIKTFAEG